MQHWKAHYRDALHDADITMINTEEDYAADPLSFTLDGVTFRGASISSFQLADETQYEKCCFTCQYADYSPYGNDDYGAMSCYRRHKEDCLMVNSKEDYFKYLEGKDADGRQET